MRKKERHTAIKEEMSGEAVCLSLFTVQVLVLGGRTAATPTIQGPRKVNRGSQEPTSGLTVRLLAHLHFLGPWGTKTCRPTAALLSLLISGWDDKGLCAGFLGDINCQPKGKRDMSWQLCHVEPQEHNLGL